jgi:hypothetical protein
MPASFSLGRRCPERADEGAEEEEKRLTLTLAHWGSERLCHAA